jgi:hypothetical protein
MYMRRLLTWILACILVAGMTASPVLADGTPAGGGTGGDIHPWDTNDGDSDAGGENVAAVAARSALVIVRTGTMGQFTLMRISFTPTASRSVSVQKGSSTDVYGAKLATKTVNR